MVKYLYTDHVNTKINISVTVCTYDHTISVKTLTFLVHWILTSWRVKSVYSNTRVLTFHLHPQLVSLRYSALIMSGMSWLMVFNVTFKYISCIWWGWKLGISSVESIGDWSDILGYRRCVSSILLILKFMHWIELYVHVNAI